MTLEQLAAKVRSSGAIVSIWYEPSIGAITITARRLALMEEHESRRVVSEELLGAKLADVVSLEMENALASLDKHLAEREHRAAVRGRKHLKAVP